SSTGAGSPRPRCRSTPALVIVVSPVDFGSRAAGSGPAALPSRYVHLTSAPPSPASSTIVHVKVPLVKRTPYSAPRTAIQFSWFLPVASIQSPSANASGWVPGLSPVAVVAGVGEVVAG